MNQNDLVATAFNDGAIKIWKSLPDSHYISLQRQLSGHKAPTDFLSMHNSSAFLTCAEDGTVKLWDIETGDCLATLNVTIGDGKHVVPGLLKLVLSCPMVKSSRLIQMFPI